ncbi:MAG: DMT family transporter [Planctomycetes bacterium]|nr:DMT family transporter [Planctomycetota bacterium]
MVFPPARLARFASRQKGILLMVLAGFAFSVMGALVKWSARSLPIFELVFLRSLFALVPLLLFFALRRSWPRARSWRLLFLRSAVGVAAISLLFYAIAHLDLATATLLNNTSPVFGVLFAIFFLKERVHRAVPALVLVALAGCVLLISPDLKSAAGSTVAGLAGALSAVLSALAYTTVRELRRSDHPLDIVFFFTAFNVAISAPLLPFSYRMPGAPEWLAMAGAGFAAALAQYALTLALRVERAAIAVPFAYTGVLFAALFGYVFWGEVLTPIAMAGGGLVLLAGISISVLAGREKVPPAALQGAGEPT